MLSLSIMFFIGGIIASGWFEWFNSTDQLVRRLQKNILRAQKELSVKVNHIRSGIDKVATGHTGIPDSYRSAFKDHGQIFLLYDHDSLIDWTDNLFEAPVNLSYELLSHPFIDGSNGYFLLSSSKTEQYTIVGLQLVKFSYQYDNQYLPRNFYHKFRMPQEADISFDTGTNLIRGEDGTGLFTLSMGTTAQPYGFFMFLIFALYVTSFLCLISALFGLYLITIEHFKAKRWLLLFFLADVIILRGFQFYFRFPGSLYALDLFSPLHFASSEILPSLGDLLINALLVLQVVYFYFKYPPLREINPSAKSTAKAGVVLISALSIIGLFEVLQTLIQSLVLNSSIPLKFYDLINLSAYSITGLTIIGAALTAFFLLSECISRISYRILEYDGRYTWIIVLLLLFYAGWLYAGTDRNPLLALLLAMVFLLLNLKHSFSFSAFLKSARVFLMLLVLALTGTLLLNTHIRAKEYEQRTILASHLSDARDKLAEFNYKQAASGIQSDTLLKTLLTDFAATGNNEMRAVDYIQNTYFSGFWSRYHVQLTLCRPGKKLNVKPEDFITGCDEYFNRQIQQFLKPVDSTGFYFLRQTVDVTYYLGKIILPVNSGFQKFPVTLYVEIDSKNLNRGQGYPELLMDKSLPSIDNLSGYSYAFYNKGELVRNVGKFAYNTTDVQYKHRANSSGFFSLNGYSHLLHTVDASTVLIISKEKPGFADLIAPFSFIFICLLFLVLIVLCIDGNILKINHITITFRLRLQILMVLIILASSIVIGTVTIIYLNQLNFSKNKGIITEKMNTVLVELENSYSNEARLTSGMQDVLSNDLVRLSNSIFTDINLYDLSGRLLASSRSQVFTDGLISGQMNAEGFRKLSGVRESIFIHKENIGNYSFLSAYAPLRNVDNKLIGYINLPYFARQEDLRQEVSRLLTTFVNIYILLTAIAVLFALLISRNITRPLQLISKQLGKFRLGAANARIEWNRTDEIGDLIAEYNRMVDELTRSAERLARSERESAWREMARQVAHEIKNPLTPIKLSMQHLIKAWDEKAPDWEARLKRFSQTLIVQIDTLSAIATEFSDFAQLPGSEPKRVDIQQIILNSSQLFRDVENLSIIFPDETGRFYAYADERQMLRVFNNLIKNSIQAMVPGQKGIIEITLEDQGDECLITFTDNGQGIPADQQPRIFSPNFTTKSAGMGLGLAMVKSIIDNADGNIRFDSVEGQGTTFHIILPSGPADAIQS